MKSKLVRLYFSDYIFCEAHYIDLQQFIIFMTAKTNKQKVIKIIVDKYKYTSRNFGEFQRKLLMSTY